MARLARVILPGYPHHITQRGNRRQDVFFEEGDYEHYLELLTQWCTHESIEIWAYCLMTNHVHLIVMPKKKSNLSKAIGEVHRRYTRMINLRKRWKGYLWQGRFASYPMEESWLLKAVAYVELNPVKAGLVSSPAGCNHILTGSWTLAYWVLIWFSHWHLGTAIWQGPRRWITLGGNLAGNPSAVSKMVGLAGQNVGTTFMCRTGC
jgi:REP element-mobilizing transposase RayT